MHNYHLDRGAPRCAFKVDIQKAYDTVDWDFLKLILGAFGFHHRMVAWIMECVTSTSFSICINGRLHGYFKGKRGLRQGDHMSPYLFTLIMEVLTLMLQRRVRDSEMFTYHRYCSKLELINLCFVDDLFLFAHGDVHSAKVIMDSLEKFKRASGLTPSIPKSTAYFCNVLNQVKIAILRVIPFEEGRFPVKYLGVPLVSSRLIYRDCRELIEKVRGCINDWKNKSLSAAGRLQLIRSVLCSMHIYWASMFILPSRILLDVEQLMRGFLWCQGPMKRGRAKDVPCRDRLMASAWFDTWWNVGPLSKIVTTRDIFRAGFDMSIKVNELIVNARVMSWNGVLMQVWLCLFLVSNVWNCIRPHSEGVPWHDVVWFANCVPRFLFLLWVVIYGRLKTQDMLQHWDVNASLMASCSLCEGQPDSYSHLFFECGFSSQVWNHMKGLAGLSNVRGEYKEIIDYLIPYAKRRSCKSVIAKLVFSASVYYIWQERNARLFSNQKQNSAQLIEVIKSAVHLKLISCSFKKTRAGLEFGRVWKLPETIFISVP
ncbi:hypothetical protein Tco_0612198 [Tanacetum coccineum]